VDDSDGERSFLRGYTVRKFRAVVGQSFLLISEQQRFADSAEVFLALALFKRFQQW